MNSFCTIITSDHAHYVIAQYRSFSRYADIPLHVLCVDREYIVEQRYTVIAGISFTYLDELKLDAIGAGIVNTYAPSSDELRWCMKAEWLRYLLENGVAEKAIYLDHDIYFFQNPDFLFDQLNLAAILLSPHWRSTDPGLDPANFEMNFRDGIYNGGFLGSTKAGLSALRWLSSACLYKCELNAARGLFYDQKYYDLLQSRFPDVISLRHKGCNVANWNRIDCQRVQMGDQVLINGNEPIVFIHFTKSTIHGIRDGSDGLLTPFLNEYEETLRQINPSHLTPTFEVNTKTPARKSILKRMIHKLNRLKKSQYL